MPSAARTAPQPAHRTARPRVTAVLLCNLGTPDAPTAAGGAPLPRASSWATRAWWRSRAPLWLPLLHGVILPLRPAKSAAKYATIWTPKARR